MFAAFATRIARAGSTASSTDDLQAFAASLVGSTGASTPTSVGGDLVINGINLGPYGWVSKTTSQTISTFTATDWFTATADQGALVIIDGNLTINSGITFTPSVRKKFVCVYVKGTLTLNGSISMTRRGAPGTASFIQCTASHRVDTAGGSAGAARSVIGEGNNGGNYSGSYYGCGGGGSGGVSQSDSNSGAGAAGSVFSSGGGGGGTRGTSGAGSATANGGAGGAGANADSNGGCGNPSAAVSLGDARSVVQEGTGGVVVVFATVATSGTGSIEAKGGDNVGANDAPGPTNSGVGGGASGGGCVLLFAPSNPGITLSAAGGSATAIGTVPLNRGGNGGNGSAAFVVI